jgi:hypothetical protein
MKRFAIILLVCSLCGGCAINSGVVPIGKDTYNVSCQAASGFVSPNATKCRTLSEANQFCVAQGKSLKVLFFKEHHPPYILGNFPRAEVRFKCLDANDPELKTGEFLAIQQFAQGIKIEGDDNFALETKLKTLNKLLFDGLITKNEFDEQKKKLLNDYTNK